MAMSRQRLKLSDEDPLRQDYVLPDCGSRLLGAGSDGFVVQAVSRRSGYSDALKFARDSANDTQREVQASQAIGRHAHIVELLKVYAPHGVRSTPVLAFPELHGTLADLARRGRRSGVLNYSLAGELAQQCLEGLAHVHQCRVVHRDLSPSNILVDISPSANTGHMQLAVKISDFSRARVLPVEGASEHAGVEQQPGHTYAMTPSLGAMRYSAPELLFCAWEESCEYGVGVDIWAFGAIWFEILSSAQLIPGTSDAKNMAALTCRLGECPPQLFSSSRFDGIRTAAQEHVADLREEVLPLQRYAVVGQPGWEVLAAALRWDSSLRPSAAALKELPWAPREAGSECQTHSSLAPTQGSAQSAASSSKGAVPAVQPPPPQAGSACQTRSSLAPTQGSAQSAASSSQGAAEPAALPPPPPPSPPEQERSARGASAAVATLHPQIDQRWGNLAGKLLPEELIETVWRFCREPVPTRDDTRGTCQCAGHCYQASHRYWNGCYSKVVVQGASYCSLCLCTVPGCSCPRLHGPYCSKHKRIKLPLALRLAQAARPWMMSLIPCDVTDFLSRFKSIRGNLAVLAMSALVKEPMAVSAMLDRLPPSLDVTAESLQAALMGMLHSVKSDEHDQQMRQLNRQGVARWLGSASTCRIWGNRRERPDRPAKHSTGFVDQAHRQAESSSESFGQAEQADPSEGEAANKDAARSQAEG